MSAGGVVAGRATRVLVAHPRSTARSQIGAALHALSADLCGEATDRATAVRRTIETRPDVCIIDVGLPGGGFDAAQVITVELERTSVIMVGDTDCEADLLSAARAGAVGYLVHGVDWACLGPALEAARRGEAVVPRRHIGRLLREVQLLDGVHHGEVAHSGDGIRLAALTRREREVLDRLCEGDGTTEIARLLSVAPVTVRTHVASIVHKLRVRGRTEAVAWMAGSHPMTVRQSGGVPVRLP